MHVVLATFNRDSLSETDQTEFGGGVVSLAKVAVNSRRRCGVDNFSVLVVLHVLEGFLSQVEGGCEVNIDDTLPVIG